MTWRLSPVVGQVPTGVQQAGGYAQATADAYTYGAASAALSEGQAMAAWADLSAKQNYPAITTVKGGPAPMACPPGWLFALDGKTCVNQRNVHVLPAAKSSCESSLAYISCHPLVLWYQLHVPDLFPPTGDDALDRARSELPDALGELGWLSEGHWPDVSSGVHALARTLMAYQGTPIFDRYTEVEFEAKLSEGIAATYDAAVASGARPASWLTSGIKIAPRRQGLGLVVLGVLAASAAGAAWLLVPATHAPVLGAIAAAKHLTSSIAAGASRLLRR